MLMGKTQEKEERGDVAELGERGGLVQQGAGSWVISRQHERGEKCTQSWPVGREQVGLDVWPVCGDYVVRPGVCRDLP